MYYYVTVGGGVKKFYMGWKVKRGKDGKLDEKIFERHSWEEN
jgi:hypothetical protein